VAVFAVPFWKIFVFGGNSGDLNDSNTNPQARFGGPSRLPSPRPSLTTRLSRPSSPPPQGNYLSDLVVYETGQKAWSNPQVVGQTPAPRADTQMVRVWFGQEVLMGHAAARMQHAERLRLWRHHLIHCCC
jgi:dynein heavy chain